jgi:hypothetical protein
VPDLPVILEKVDAFEAYVKQQKQRQFKEKLDTMAF